jgi:hypothetical protein
MSSEPKSTSTTAVLVCSSTVSNPISSDSMSGVEWLAVVHASQPPNTSASTTQPATSARRRHGAGAPYRSEREASELTGKA